MSLATVVSSDDGVDALATALAAPHTFYELGRGPTTVSSTYIKSHQVRESAANLVYFLKGNIKGRVPAGCIFRQTWHFSKPGKGSHTQSRFRGWGGGWGTQVQRLAPAGYCFAFPPRPVIIKAAIDYWGPTMCQDSFHGQSPLFFLQSCYKELVLTPPHSRDSRLGSLDKLPWFGKQFGKRHRNNHIWNVYDIMLSKKSKHNDSNSVTLYVDKNS